MAHHETATAISLHIFCRAIVSQRPRITALYLHIHNLCFR